LNEAVDAAQNCPLIWYYALPEVYARKEEVEESIGLETKRL